MLVLGLFVGMRSSYAYTRLRAWGLLLITPLHMITDLLVLLGGIGCLRRRLRRRGLLIIGSWGGIGLSLGTATPNSVILISSDSRYRSVDALRIVYQVGYYIQYAAAGVIFSVVTLVFLTRRQVAELFTSAE